MMLAADEDTLCGQTQNDGVNKDIGEIYHGNEAQNNYDFGRIQKSDLFIEQLNEIAPGEGSFDRAR